MTKIVLVLLGGAFGTGLRYFFSILIYSRVKDPTFPYANLVINVSGSLLIGFLAQLFESRVLVSPVTRVALLTGVLGGYTTFSSFAYETFSLIRDGEFRACNVKCVRKMTTLKCCQCVDSRPDKSNSLQLALPAAFLLQ